jgi:hypothetical protein
VGEVDERPDEGVRSLMPRSGTSVTKAAIDARFLIFVQLSPTYEAGAFLGLSKPESVALLDA